MSTLPRSDDYRYTVLLQGSAVTPLAAVEAYFGPLKFQVLNISLGGLALLFGSDPTIKVGDIVDVSVSIRERAFPVQLEVRGIRGLRVSCSFVDPPQNFVGALKEFMRPKILGASLQRDEKLSSDSSHLGLVTGAHKFSAFSAHNQTGFFAWCDAQSRLLKIVGCTSDLIMEWAKGSSVKTGRLTDAVALEQALAEVEARGVAPHINWSNVPDKGVMNYFADIMLAWLPAADAKAFVEGIFGISAGKSDETAPAATPNPVVTSIQDTDALKFPKF